jgi:hypothetical protein
MELTSKRGPPLRRDGGGDYHNRDLSGTAQVRANEKAQDHQNRSSGKSSWFYLAHGACFRGNLLPEVIHRLKISPSLGGVAQSSPAIVGISFALNRLHSAGTAGHAPGLASPRAARGSGTANPGPTNFMTRSYLHASLNISTVPEALRISRKFFATNGKRLDIPISEWRQIRFRPEPAHTGRDPFGNVRHVAFGSQ